jgi:hypothetical protein
MQLSELIWGLFIQSAFQQNTNILDKQGNSYFNSIIMHNTELEQNMWNDLQDRWKCPHGLIKSRFCKWLQNDYHYTQITHIELTPKGQVLQKLPVEQLLKNFQTFSWTQRFITMFTRALHWFLSWTRSIHSIPPLPICVTILILSAHLHLRLPNGLFPCGFPTNK